MNDHRVFHREVNHIVRNLRLTIGQNIHALRRKDGITLKKLALTSHLSPDIIDRVELGKGEIDLIHVARLALVLQTDILSLLIPPGEAKGKIANRRMRILPN
jgi:transcriptional regulator with XRE-family HTH domain